MQYTTLGTSGLIVSRISFGAMGFAYGTKPGYVASKAEIKRADTLVRCALDAGVNFFDTSDVYANGLSEKMLGAALKGRRNDAVIATKVGFRTGPPLTQGNLTRRHILWSVDESLKRLGTDWIDVYIAHREDKYTPLEETLSALDEVVRAGKVRYLGFSNWSAWKVAAAMEIQKFNGLAPFTHGQMWYSLLGRDVERDVIPMMQRYGLGMTVWSPLAAGFLSGKYNKENLPDPERGYTRVNLFPYDKKHAFRLLDRMATIAKKRGTGVAQIAIAWLLSNPTVSSVILGASKAAQLEENLSSTNIQLSPSEVSQLNAATQLAPVYPNWFIDSIGDDAATRKVLTP